MVTSILFALNDERCSIELIMESHPYGCTGNDEY